MMVMMMMIIKFLSPQFADRLVGPINLLSFIPGIERSLMQSGVEVRNAWS
jgi:hypothetical protein